MSGMGKPSGDLQTWVYRTGSDTWQSGSTGAGGGGSGSFQRRISPDQFDAAVWL